MRRKLQGALRLSAADWHILLHAWLLLLAVDLALRVLAFRLVASWAAGTSSTAADPNDTPDPQRFRHLVGIAARHHLYPILCLRQALVLQWLLQRRRVAAELTIGVHKGTDALRAHAWLEINGKPIGEASEVLRDYAVLQASH